MNLVSCHSHCCDLLLAKAKIRIVELLTGWMEEKAGESQPEFCFIISALVQWLFSAHQETTSSPPSGSTVAALTSPTETTARNFTSAPRPQWRHFRRLDVVFSLILKRDPVTVS
ncbi:hypothetical protein ATANTOWER_001998 [Ataeniobius toweri]|uniref:Uncharacterized protein n=1 Tax=Ataeniobius toweri TaxID=208326 RepID=A0ABU7CE14_9TELE|nr:hypothetical protein [Ataeniobius toweri]